MYETMYESSPFYLIRERELFGKIYTIEKMDIPYTI